MPVRRIFILSILMIVVLQILCLGSVEPSINWPLENPLSFLLNWSLVSSFLIAALSITHSERVSIALVCGSLFLFGVVGAFKKQMLGMPIIPWDFALAKEAIETLIATKKLSLIALIAFVLTTASVAAIARFVRLSMSPISVHQRIGWGFFSMLFLTLVLLKNNPLHEWLFTHELKLQKNNRPIENVQNNGILISFILYLEKGNLYPPSDFSEEKAHKAIEKYSHFETRSPSSAENIRPDIIVIMSESLFDPAELNGVKWKKDPLEFTRTLSRNPELNLAVVPTYGGKTANSEFEFLTGHSVRFLARGVVPYTQLIQGPQTSLVQTLKDQGYSTTAIHPGDRKFFNRETVYKYLGFDKFKANESFPNAPIVGHNIADESILEVLKASLGSEDRPSFHFIVTIQNHMPYDGGPFDLSNSMFSTDGLSKEEQVVLNYYSHLVEKSDEFHKDLVEYLNTRKRPTLLLIFGDHLPALLPNYQIFSEHLVQSTNSQNWTPSEWQKMYSTPLITWSNFGYQGETEPLEVSFLGVRTLNKLGIELAPYQKFLVDFSNHLRIVNPNIEVKKEGEIQDYWSTYKILQYGVLSGLLTKSALVSENNAN